MGSLVLVRSSAISPISNGATAAVWVIKQIRQSVVAGEIARRVGLEVEVCEGRPQKCAACPILTSKTTSRVRIHTQRSRLFLLLCGTGPGTEFSQRIKLCLS